VFAGKKSAQIREILISESAWEEMTCLFAPSLGVELALKDVGITYCLEERVAEHIKTGELHIVLPDWSPIEPAMHLYYPGHRQVPQGLKELIEVLRSAYLDVA